MGFLKDHKDENILALFKEDYYGLATEIEMFVLFKGLKTTRKFGCP